MNRQSSPTVSCVQTTSTTALIRTQVRKMLPAYYDKGRGYITINISGGTIGNDYEYIYNPTDEQKRSDTKHHFRLSEPSAIH